MDDDWFGLGNFHEGGVYYVNGAPQLEQVVPQLVAQVPAPPPDPPHTPLPNKKPPHTTE